MMKVDEKECTGCGICMEACPQGAIYLVDGKAQVDPARCTECGVCVENCPEEAIHLERRPVWQPQAAVRTIEAWERGSPVATPKAPWAAVALDLVGRYFLPRLADGILSFMESSRASSGTLQPRQESSAIMQAGRPLAARPMARNGRGRRGRRRRRGFRTGLRGGSESRF